MINYFTIDFSQNVKVTLELNLCIEIILVLITG